MGEKLVKMLRFEFRAKMPIPMYNFWRENSSDIQTLWETPKGLAESPIQIENQCMFDDCVHKGHLTENNLARGLWQM